MKKAAFVLYPLMMILVAVLLAAKDSMGGHIRQLEITPDQPGVIHLAFGRTTAISFSTRPEKVVPGSPQAIEVNFLGKDLTVRPLSPKAGNLLVYTKTSRFVLLLQVGSEGQYDDVVKVAPAFSKKPVRLMEDAARIETVELVSDGTSVKVPILLRTDERVIEGPELNDALQTQGLWNTKRHPVCQGCLIRRDAESVRITCSQPIHEISCMGGRSKITVRRKTS